MHCLSHLRWVGCSVVVICVLLNAPAVHAHQSLRASAAYLQAPAPNSDEALAFMTVENGTMYDAYLTGGHSDVAGVIELRTIVQVGKPAVTVSEVPVPSYGKVEMSQGGIHLRLTKLKRPLKVGDTVSLSLTTDSGAAVTVSAMVK